MAHKIKNSKLIPKKVVSTLNLLLADEAISGKLLLVAAVLALIAVNSPFSSVYESFWHTNLSLGLGQFTLSEDLRHWVNDALMALFFLVVGLEIKREVVTGELRKPKVALLPIVAAVGGMIVPAFIYVACNFGQESARGWGIPVATDIAFAIGVLIVLGSRIPSSLKTFLLTLAIVDDLLAIIIIAIFYTNDTNVLALFAAGGFIVLLLASRKIWPNSLLPYGLIGVGLWIALQASGVHAAIAGAIVGFLAPMKYLEGPSVAERLERAIIPISTLVVIPLFAFANAGVVLTGISLSGELQPIVVGVILGLLVGKTVGILGSAWLLTRFRLATLPKGVNWQQMTGVSLLAGIGFTVSIFVTELAFAGNEDYIAAAKIGIIIASTIAAGLGSIVLLKNSNKKAPEK